MKYFPLYVLLLACALAVSSCNKEGDNANMDLEPQSLDDMITPPSFNYETTRNVEINLTLNAADGNPIAHIPVKIGRLENQEMVEMFTLLTDANGRVNGIYTVATYIKELVVSTNYIGLPNDIIVNTEGGVVSLNFNGSNVSGSYKKISLEQQNIIDYNEYASKFNTLHTYAYLSSYNSLGVPSVMATRDVVTSSMLSYINNSLPESRPVPTFHPTFLGANLNTDLDITQTADVWITFVHEGAGYKNSLGFYTYPTSNPPTSASDIDTIFFAFPNASYLNSGGGLVSGDKVRIGTFAPGTSIGFVCVSNGWNGSVVGNGAFIHYTDIALNGPATSLVNQQNVLLHDAVNNIFYLGFEDIDRTNGGCDQDFNDIVFYAKSNPITAISSSNMPKADDGYDTDGDLVSDIYDDFPTDPTLAYRLVYPSKNKYGTLAYEDLWPAKGDYDFNDLVLGYQYELLVNANNIVKTINSSFAIRAIGAHYSHGFGFQLNIPSNMVNSVTGAQYFNNIINLNANGTEQGQSKATIIAFDNDYNVMNRAQGNTLNTETTKAYAQPDTVKVQINVSGSYTPTTIGFSPFNPFIFIGSDRGKEVHLAGYAPTTLANTQYFKTLQDNTSIAGGVLYKSKNNLPFAVHLAQEFEYPIERVPVNQGHLKFISWSQSGGSSFTDWYMNNSGYRDNNKLFKK